MFSTIVRGFVRGTIGVEKKRERTGMAVKEVKRRRE